MAEQWQNDGNVDVGHIYAWLSRDAEGIEGIIAAPVGDGGIMPLVAANRATAMKLAPLAELSGMARGHRAELVTFVREVGQS